MSFIKTIPASEASDAVLTMYARQESAWGYVPDYAKVFCHRPELMARWGQMLAEVKRHVDARRLELVTFAAAHELRHSSCSLAHGAELAKIIGKDAVIAIANGQHTNVLSDGERAIVRFARRVAKDASRITRGEVAALREIHGLGDAEIFDIVAIAASRSFFTKVLDALGSEPDMEFMTMDKDLREALTVGRPIACRGAERLPRPALARAS
ncbi:MAG: peroxidase [Gammaproteobacteria bacterium]|nr:peroxidase [Gammaproteobacteria bacterium]